MNSLNWLINFIPMITSLLSPDASSLGDIKELKEESRRDQRMCLHQWFDKRHKAVPTELEVKQQETRGNIYVSNKRSTRNVTR